MWLGVRQSIQNPFYSTKFFIFSAFSTFNFKFCFIESRYIPNCTCIILHVNFQPTNPYLFITLFVLLAIKQLVSLNIYLHTKKYISQLELQHYSWCVQIILNLKVIGGIVLINEMRLRSCELSSDRNKDLGRNPYITYIKYSYPVTNYKWDINMTKVPKKLSSSC